ncbi:MAG: hypothetical protein AB7N71_09890, partial [Phycisphaerae bacterium]
MLRFRMVSWAIYSAVLMVSGNVQAADERELADLLAASETKLAHAVAAVQERFPEACPLFARADVEKGKLRFQIDMLRKNQPATCTVNDQGDVGEIDA